MKGMEAVHQRRESATSVRCYYALEGPDETPAITTAPEKKALCVWKSFDMVLHARCQRLW